MVAKNKKHGKIPQVVKYRKLHEVISEREKEQEFVYSFIQKTQLKNWSDYGTKY